MTWPVDNLLYTCHCQQMKSSLVIMCEWEEVRMKGMDILTSFCDISRLKCRRTQHYNSLYAHRSLRLCSHRITTLIHTHPFLWGIQSCQFMSCKMQVEMYQKMGVSSSCKSHSKSRQTANVFPHWAAATWGNSDNPKWQRDVIGLIFECLRILLPRNYATWYRAVGWHSFLSLLWWGWRWGMGLTFSWDPTTLWI